MQQEQAAELAAACDANDPLLLEVWPMILKDRGLNEAGAGDDICGDAARRAFLDELQLAKPVLAKGPRVAVARWFSWVSAWKTWDSKWGTRLFLLLALCLNKGWASSIEDVRGTDLGVPPGGAADTADPSAGAAASSDAGGGEQLGGSSASSSSRPAKPLHLQSTMKQTAEAKKSQAALRATSANTLHAVCKLMCSEDFLANARMLGFCATSEWAAFNAMVDQCKGPDATMKVYIKWAQNSWLDPLAETVQVSQDLQALSKIGFITDVVARHLRDDSLKAWQDALACTLGTPILNIIRERSGSMAWHTSGIAALAPILSDEPAEVKKAMALLRSQVLAWEAAMTKGSLMQSMASRAFLHPTFMKWAVAFAKACSYKTASPQLIQLVSTLFRGWGQSRVVEKCNQALRDAETKDSSSKVMKMLKLWHVPVGSNLMSQFDRAGVQPSCQTSTMGSLTLEKLYSSETLKPAGRGGPPPTEAEERSSRLAKELGGITARKSWLSYSPLGSQSLVAEMALMMHLYTHSTSDSAPDSWKGRLLPEGQLVVCQALGEAFICIRAYGCAWLGWPAMKLHDGCWTWSTKLGHGRGALQWRFSFNFDPRQVIPTRFGSPLPVAHSTGKAVGTRVCFIATGPAMPLLKWHCKHGFPHIPEAPLRALHAEFGLELPPSQGGAFKQRLVASLLLHLEPGMSADEAAQALQTASMIEHVDGATFDAIDEEMINDVVLASERSSMKEYCKEVQLAEAREKDQRIAIKEITSACKFKPSRKVQARPAPRWSGAADAPASDVMAWLLKHAPPAGNVMADAGNGRWFVTYPFRGWGRSISWSRRGHGCAAGMVLHQLWSWHHDATGAALPFALEDVL